MSNPLSMARDDLVVISNNIYHLKDILEFTLNGKKAFRYIFENNYRDILVEVKKELTLNYQIFLYKSIDIVDYSSQFISMLGANTISYPNSLVSNRPIFKRVNMRGELYEVIKHIVDEEELPEDFQDLNYHVDENGVYYFLTRKYNSTKRLYCSNNLTESWEYKQDGNIRLLIESHPNSNRVLIYKGEEIRKSEIKSLKHCETVLSQSQPYPQSYLYIS
jgi:hypothetical protein